MQCIQPLLVKVSVFIRNSLVDHLKASAITFNPNVY